MNRIQGEGVQARVRPCGARTRVLPTLVVWFVTAGAVAQEAPGGGMGQGEALINVRSDVRLGIKGTAGTTSERLQELADAIADQMGEVRACYATLVKNRPSATGSISIRIALERGGAGPAVETKEKEGTDVELTPCVRKVLARGNYAKVGRPAAAVVSLDFQNSRARGQSVMAAHQAELAAVEVRESAGGGFEASWATHGQEVQFAVRGADKQAVDAVTRALRARFGGFVDCRRRSQQGDRSPAGVTKVTVRIEAGGGLAGDVESTTVDFERRVVPCVDKAFDKLSAEGAPARKRVDVEVTFAP